MNSIVIGGRLCKGGELKTSAGDKEFYRGSIAVWNSWTKESEFFDFVIFGKKAAFFADWAKDGMFVNLKGEVGINKWTDKSGQNRTSWSVRVADFELPRSKEKVDDGRPDGSEAGPMPNSDGGDEDLPF